MRSGTESRSPARKPRQVMIVDVRPEGGGRVRAVLLRSRICLFVTAITSASCLQRRHLGFISKETRLSLID